MTEPVLSEPTLTRKTKDKWMEMPTVSPGCPPGLEYLSQLDQLVIHQKVDIFEALTDIDMKNKYVVKNSTGQQCYYAYEESGFCMRFFCGSERGFQIHILDNLGNEVIRVEREFRCCVGCCCCITGDTCAYNVSVESPPGTPIGRIVQMWSKWTPKYAVRNANDETVFVIRGPCCVCSGPCFPGDVPFEIFTSDRNQIIGSISRQYAGFAKEFWTNANKFGVSFPADLDVKCKALLLGALFLIDMMFFEDNKND